MADRQPTPSAAKTEPREVILDAILMPDATREGAAVRNAGRKALDELLTEVEWLRDVAHAAECLIKSEDVRLGDEDQIRLSNLLSDARRPL